MSEGIARAQIDPTSSTTLAEMNGTLKSPNRSSAGYITITATQKVGRPPPFETIGKGSREGSGRPVGLNTARRPWGIRSAKGAQFRGRNSVGHRALQRLL
jgi:hypothetical protein